MQDFLVLMVNLDLQERLEQMDFQDWLARLDFLVTEVFLALLAQVVLLEWLVRWESQDCQAEMVFQGHQPGLDSLEMLELQELLAGQEGSE